MHIQRKNPYIIDNPNYVNAKESVLKHMRERWIPQLRNSNSVEFYELASAGEFHLDLAQESHFERQGFFDAELRNDVEHPEDSAEQMRIQLDQGILRTVIYEDIIPSHRHTIANVLCPWRAEILNTMIIEGTRHISALRRFERYCFTDTLLIPQLQMRSKCVKNVQGCLIRGVKPR